MPDVLPIVELQAQAILTQLQTIGVGDGWLTVPLSIIRPWKFEPQHMQICLVQGDPEPIGEEPVNHDDWNQHWDIQLFVMPPEDDETPVDTYINLLAADVKKAIDGDVAWRTFAINHALGQVVPFGPPIPVSGGVMDLSVHMRTIYGDPLTRGY